MTTKDKAAACSEGDDSRLLLLSASDNVMVARREIAAGAPISIGGVSTTAASRIPLGHKVARCAILSGQKIVKYGAPIGSATESIAIGEHVHIHNMKSDYTKTHVVEATDEENTR